MEAPTNFCNFEYIKKAIMPGKIAATTVQKIKSLLNEVV
jgi:hypothetical protein